MLTIHQPSFPGVSSSGISMFDHRNHSAWADFKAWLLHREDMDRKARGEPALEVEIAALLDAAMPDLNTQKHSTPAD